MAAIGDLVHETTASTGTGNLTLAAVSGKRGFAAVFSTGGANVFHYFISNRSAAEWEWGTGSMSDATTLVRDTVVASSNSNNAVNFSAGTKDVVNDLPSANQLDKSTVSANGLSLITAANYAAMRALLDLEAGTDFLPPAAIAAAYQPLDADLTSWAGVTRASGFDTFAATPSGANFKALLSDDPLTSDIGGTGNAFTKFSGPASAEKTFTLPNASSTIKVAGKETIWVPAGAMKSRTTNGAASGTAEMTTNKNMFVTLDFDTTTQEFAQFEVFFPKSWNLGTVTFQPVLSHASGSGNVVFGLAGVARSNDDAGDVAFGTAQTSDRTIGTANDIYIGPESSAITIAGSPAAGDTVQFQVNRTVASDNLGVDARLHGVLLFFTTNAADDT